MEANSNKDIVTLKAYFGTKLDTSLKNFLTIGVHTPSLWPDLFWPTYQDSIKVIWSQSQPCPTETYAKAFGLDFEEVSKDNGINLQSKRSKFTTDVDCSSPEQQQRLWHPGWLALGLHHPRHTAVVLATPPKH